MIIHCCRNRGWNQKQKHKKTALEQRGMLRIWRRDCALCVIGNVFPCRQPHNHSATLLRGHSTLVPRIKTARRFTAKNPDDKMISKGGCIKSPKTILHGRDAILRVRVKWLIFNMVSQLWADVKYHVPTGFGFSPKAVNALETCRRHGPTL